MMKMMVSKDDSIINVRWPITIYCATMPTNDCTPLEPLRTFVGPRGPYESLSSIFSLRKISGRISEPNASARLVLQKYLPNP